MISQSAHAKLIIALDVDTKQKALELVEALAGVPGMFKIGSQLFTAAGPDIVREVIKKGAKIFLDLKFHDIPATVAAAGVEATRLGVSIFNIHASGGGEMMKRTAAAVSECAEREGLSRPKVIGVTVLTSSDAIELDQVGISRSPGDQAVLLAQLASDNGMDGVVASPEEISLVRSAAVTSDFIIVTPGVRPAGSEKNDQKRVMTPAEAIARGADYLVVGRPILSAADPESAAENIVREISDGMKASAEAAQ
ncbi:MAG: orotidine-5-phosphate decarboxylase [Blastocatellia bacterium]|jgi:orotidine-5'-phosphate decarboxylase|nr:orotidine-5-phosphate decarboxylase [Blastocatellia bacterium]